MKMIPRKRLQVLLYILQISYVFGDVANLGKEDSDINELVPDSNIVIQTSDDSTAFTVKPPNEDSSDQTLSLEKKESSKTIPGEDSSNYESKENDGNISQENIHNDLAAELNGIMLFYFSEKIFLIV